MSKAIPRKTAGLENSEEYLCGEPSSEKKNIKPKKKKTQKTFSYTNKPKKFRK